MNNVTLGGADPRTGQRFAHCETMGGGMGGRNGQPGISGGEPRGAGRNTPIRGGEEMPVAGNTWLHLNAGDRLRIESPGGGGYGPPEETPHS